MAAPVVYIDQVFIGNLLMNYIILWATAKIGRVERGRARLLTGSVLGALYSLVVFWPALNFWSAPVFKILASIVVAGAVFVPLSPPKFVVCLGAFYLASFALGGAVLGAIFLSGRGILVSNWGLAEVIDKYFFKGIFFGAAFFVAAVRTVAVLIKRGEMERYWGMPVLIRFGGGSVKTRALLDTGNSLKDPLTGRPVVIVEYGVLKPILPLDVQLYFENVKTASIWEVLSCLSLGRQAARFSAIPFRSLGQDKGVLLGFKPDEVQIVYRGRCLKAKNVLVGVCREKLDPAGSYRALVGPEVLEAA